MTPNQVALLVWTVLFLGVLAFAFRAWLSDWHRSRQFERERLNWEMDRQSAMAALDRDRRAVERDREALERERVDFLHRRSLLNDLEGPRVWICPMGVIIHASPAALKMFGYTEEQLVGENVRVLMPEPYRSEHDGYLERYRTTREKRIIDRPRELEGLRQDGTVFPILLSVSVITSPSGQESFSAMIRDITTEKYAELKAKESTV